MVDALWQTSYHELRSLGIALLDEYPHLLVADDIRKAIGWVLREVSKKQPDWTCEFLFEHIHQVAGLTLREGTKYLPTEQRERLMENYQSRTRSGR